MKEGYIPKDQRKKMLLLSDDLRMQSGVGVMSRAIVLGTAHKYNWIQVGAAVSHPEAGRVVDVSQSVSDEIGIPDAFVRIYPANGYGDQNMIRHLINVEHPSALMIFTDPRFFVWLFQQEGEIRRHMPIIYYTIWDDTPFPRYNRDYYRSCDALFAISMQSYNVVKQVLGPDNVNVI